MYFESHTLIYEYDTKSLKVTIAFVNMRLFILRSQIYK